MGLTRKLSNVYHLGRQFENQTVNSKLSKKEGGVQIIIYLYVSCKEVVGVKIYRGKIAHFIELEQYLQRMARPAGRVVTPPDPFVSCKQSACHKFEFDLLYSNLIKALLLLPVFSSRVRACKATVPKIEKYRGYEEDDLLAPSQQLQDLIYVKDSSVRKSG